MPPDRQLQPSYPISSDPGTILVESDRLIIRRYMISDAPDLAELANYQEIAVNLRDGFPHPYTLEAGQGFIQSTLSDTEDVYPNSCALFVKPGAAENPSSQPLQIGGIGMKPQKDVHYRTWEIGYFLTPSAWGKGYASEAVKAFTRWCFETWPRLHRIEADVYDHNLSSVHVLQKCGFVVEGTRRGGSEKGGILRDNIVLGLTRDDLQMFNTP